MRRLRMAVLVSGRGSNLQAIIDGIEAGKINGEIVAVISDKKRAYALKRAEGAGIQTIVIEEDSREAFQRALLDCLSAVDPDLILLAGFMRLLSPAIIQSFPGRIMNIHPSLLPSFPGVQAQRQALEYGVKVTGCTVHFVDEGMDTGPIILQEAVPVLEEDDVDSLSARILEVEHRTYVKAIQLFAQGRLEIEGRRVRILPPAPVKEEIV
ncbi:MAG: phosphoribosylglycinamide formyltransferase [Firmicutes bacterium]|nr:phosphoribosylglycinamide formyltransferase [Bacillota bacterium]